MAAAGVEQGRDRETEGRVVNVNVGILGHVDSGKTSLARALSRVVSTAGLDKHPQSALRGITLDLGFSAFTVPAPEGLSGVSWPPCDEVQFTLVDCPGHASLIRTIIGGAQIIDIMMLVVDVTKGVQTQTAECLVVGEISPTKNMLVVLNKTDMLPADSKNVAIEKMKKRLKATLKATKFADAEMVAVAASPGGDEVGQEPKPVGVDSVVQALTALVKQVDRTAAKDEPFLFAIDHCFPIKGQGTVLTGTVLQGAVAVNQTIELPMLKLQRKVKSMQMFRRPVSNASKGDRVGVCVTQLDSKLLERGLAAAPGTVPTISACMASVSRVRFFKGRIASKGKFHVTVGHTTVMAETLFLSRQRDEHQKASPDAREAVFDFAQDYSYLDELSEDTASAQELWALLTFEQPITCPRNALFIGAKLDADVHANACRLAFHGRIAAIIDPNDKSDLQQLRVYKVKQRQGVIERVVDSTSVIGKNMFKKETDINLFSNLQVTAAGGRSGVIQGSFGKSGKFKVVFRDGIPPDSAGQMLELRFKRYVFDPHKRMAQA
eukprot:jgi/Chlat1/5542/Chrsp369S00410